MDRTCLPRTSLVQRITPFRSGLVVLAWGVFWVSSRTPAVLEVGGDENRGGTRQMGKTRWLRLRQRWRKDNFNGSHRCLLNRRRWSGTRSVLAHRRAPLPCETLGLVY